MRQERTIEILGRIARLKLIPEVTLDDVSSAAPLANALCAGGLPCAEVSFRSTVTPECIRAMRLAHPRMLVGAGTVLTIRQVEQAVRAGAQFIVTPCFDPEVVDYCIAKNIPVLPGCVTPSEVAQAVKRGLLAVRFFPAEAFGGVDTIKSLAAPYTGLRFIPTGGVSLKNLREYLNCGYNIACGGNWMVKSDLIRGGNFDIIQKLTRDAVSLAAEIRP